jgi:hypothetical protein
MGDICLCLHKLFNSLPIHSYPIDFSKIPKNGIYILFETGEYAHGGNRIVRIGTHTGNNQLRSRIKQHFIQENKDRSIFRKNIGRALLNRLNDPFLAQWDLDLMTREAKQRYLPAVDLVKQQQVEHSVTEYMRQHFSFAVFQVEQKEDRLFWEARIISTVSLCNECRPSPAWLGNCSPKEKIREGGLWLVNELYKQPLSTEEFTQLEKIVLME